MQIQGTIVPMATPTTGQAGAIDDQSLDDYVEWLVAAGVDGLFPCGSIGEFSSLTDEQRERVSRRTVAAVNGAVPVYAGCGDTNVAGVQNHLQRAAEIGADAGVVVTPYYLSTTQAGLIEFYQTIADDSPLPVVLYNIPALTGEKLELSTVRELSAHDRIVAIKDSSADLGYHRDLIAETPPEFSVLQGTTRLAVASLDVGADGLVAGPANVYPRLVSELYSAHEAGNHTRADEIMSCLVHPMLSASAGMPTAAAIKHLLSVNDHSIGDPLTPLSQLTTEQRQRLSQFAKTITNENMTPAV